MPRATKTQAELNFNRLVGGRIATHREYQGLSQAALAETFDPPLTRQQVANIELGYCSASAFRVAHIADVLGVAVQELLKQ